MVDGRRENGCVEEREAGRRERSWKVRVSEADEESETEERKEAMEWIGMADGLRTCEFSWISTGDCLPLFLYSFMTNFKDDCLPSFGFSQI